MAITSRNLYLVCAALASLSVVYLSVARTTDQGVALQHEEQKSDQMKYHVEALRAQADIAKATGAIPEGWTRVSSSDGADNAAISKRPGVYLRTFNCPDQQEGKREAFEANGVQEVDLTSSSRISSGCALVRVSAAVSTLSGSGYFLSVAVPGSPDTYYECGTYGRRNDSLATCRDFLNSHTGEQVFVGIQNGNHLAIN